MSLPAIRIEGLWKQYAIGGRSRARKTFREALVEVAAAPLRRLLPSSRKQEAENRFWALRDINLEIAPGEVLGIIGRNGAGKSTLLKILSRITAPTRGRVEINGRVSSLLEVGTGFHQELTGRENIHLNGTILGMSRAEIRRKFDAIVDFSGVEKFIDTPVKHYSSGMQVRLAFAVAAHLDPEILIIDEVLAVGDADFQKKCFGKVDEIVRASGRTILFVSHNMSAITAVCTRATYLNQGAVLQVGPVYDVVTRYTGSGPSTDQFERRAPVRADLALVGAAVDYYSGNEMDESCARLTLNIFARKEVRASVDMRIKDMFGVQVGFGSIGHLDAAKVVSFKRGYNRLKVVLPTPRLALGRYSISVDLTIPTVGYYDRVDDCLLMSVEPTNGEVGVMPLKQEWGYGSVFIPMILVEQCAGSQADHGGLA